jgi:arylsulfatase A-like enzyme
VTNASLASTLDLLPTLAAMAQAPLPADRVLDGFDLSGMLVDGKPGPRESMFYYRDYRLMAIRHGRYKAHYITQDSYVPGSNQATTHDVPLLYDLEVDLGEKRDLAKSHPEVLREIERIRAAHEATMKFADSQLDRK